MESRRKKAYRYLLYHATLHTRQLQWLRFRNPLCWRRHLGQVRCCGTVADWLHNLALFSALDFDRFDEGRFWEDFDRLRGRCPEIESYRRAFEQWLSDPRF
jgi:hypothetical protein